MDDTYTKENFWGKMKRVRIKLKSVGLNCKEEFNYLTCESVKDIKLLIKRKSG